MTEHRSAMNKEKKIVFKARENCFQLKKKKKKANIREEKSYFSLLPLLLKSMFTKASFVFLNKMKKVDQYIFSRLEKKD